MGATSYTYILNVIYYSMWRYEIGSLGLIGNILYKIFSIAITLFLPLKYKKKVLNKLKNNMKEYIRLCNNKTSGLCIKNANYWFESWYGAYFTILSFPLTAMGIKLSGSLTPYCYILFPLPIFLGLIPMHRAVFHKDRYLQYFMKFERNDLQWHRKWRRISILFCVGGILMVFLGICLMVLILKE